jgi:ABC-type antimicrobial peptide transport system permease subunit
MIKNYLIVAVRNLFRHKVYSFINIAGLAVGMACCILIMLWVFHELSYDSHYENSGRLFRVAKSDEGPSSGESSAITPPPLGPVLKDEYPEIIKSARYAVEGEKIVMHDGQKFQNDILAVADPDFVEMFSFPLIWGNPATALSDKSSIIISESMSRRYFGDENPLGKIINIDRRDFTISGVMQDLPDNTHFRFDCLAPYLSQNEGFLKALDNWRFSVYYTYILLEKSAKSDLVSEKISGLINRHRPDSESQISLSLQPVERIHLYREVKDYLSGHGNIDYVYLFFGLALLVLLIAGINFVNLTTARSGNRLKEIGMRKVMGAFRKNLIIQFLGESIILSLISFICAIAIVELVLPAYSQWAGKELSLILTGNISILFGLIAIVLFTGIISGSYPAMVLSAFNPIKLFRKQIQSKGGFGGLRKILVITQFILATGLIAGSLGIYSQLQFIRNKDLGFNKEHLIYVEMAGAFGDNYESIKRELLADPAIEAVAAGPAPVEKYFDPIVNKTWPGKPDEETEDEVYWQSLTVDDDYLETLQMQIIEGVGFSAEQNGLNQSGLIINEAAAETMGMESPIGIQLTFYAYKGSTEPTKYHGTITGIVKNFHHGSMHSFVSPLVLHQDKTALYEMCVRTKPGKADRALALLRQMWEKYSPEYRFEYHFADKTIESFYKTEKRLGEIFIIFTILAIVISCLGLFGLASFVIEKRTNEIGIRKVLGASVSNIVLMLAREFVGPIILAAVIALPVVYLIIQRWLQNFAYRMPMTSEIYIFSFLLTFLIAFGAISYQAIKAALANPVKSIAYE